MTEVDPTITLTGPHGPVTLLEVFEGRSEKYAGGMDLVERATGIEPV